MISSTLSRWLSLGLLLLLLGCGGRLLRLRLGPVKVKLLVEPELPSEIEDQNGVVIPGESGMVGKILDRSLSIGEDGVIHWGAQSYGTVTDGDTIHIDHDGVHVSGEHRGDHPVDR